MKILFHLGHPAHFHLFRNVILGLQKKSCEIVILIKKKDVLEELLTISGIKYFNILPKGRKSNIFGIASGQLKQDLKLLSFSIKNKPDILIGTSVAISHVGKLLGIPSINVNEDDADVVPLYATLAYPWATTILAPKECRMGRWEHKTIFYEGYHELAYLHPENFIPNIEIAKKYVSIEKPFYLLRLAKLDAHHDTGIKGLSNELAIGVIRLLEPFGRVYVSSERQIDNQIEKYRISINPIDIHHVMAYASLFIGDSQTMAAEAGVLGVPFIRFNDFVGRISYLDDLESKYELGYGIKSDEGQKFYDKVAELINMPNRSEIFQERRKRMLSDKIDFASFMVWFIENYPNSVKIMKEESDETQRQFMKSP